MKPVMALAQLVLSLGNPSIGHCTTMPDSELAASAMTAKMPCTLTAHCVGSPPRPRAGSLHVCVAALMLMPMRASMDLAPTKLKEHFACFFLRATSFMWCPFVRRSIIPFTPASGPASLRPNAGSSSFSRAQISCFRRSVWLKLGRSNSLVASSSGTSHILLARGKWSLQESQMFWPFAAIAARFEVNPATSDAHWAGRLAVRVHFVAMSENSVATMATCAMT
mmetsp:Transcript_52738/g.139169  ORF Transcript_52738/g.139169 Transcript_52738/m.139169 type:complete len:223 (-) Transcript_52738:186-854(-)